MEALYQLSYSPETSGKSTSRVGLRHPPSMDESFVLTLSTMGSPARLLGTCTFLVFAVGLVIATATPGPLLTADDLAYLGMARTLAGDGAAPMPPQAPYGVLYPALLAPGWLVGLSESSMLVFARVVNALAGAALVPVLYSLIRRVAVVSVKPALVAAVVGASLPALYLTATIAWSERLLALLAAAGVLGLVHLAERRTAEAALGCVVLGAAMFAAHPRLGPAGVVVIVSAAWMLLAHSRKQALSVVIVGGLALWMVERARAALSEAAFASSGTYDTADLASRRGLDEVPAMMQTGLGAATYLVLAGTGLVVIGVVALARRRLIGWPTLAMLGAVLALAAWFLTGNPRADKWLHGRYIEVLAPVIVAVGFVHVRTATQRLKVVAFILLPAAGGVIAAWNGPGNNWTQPRSPIMMLGVDVGGAPFGGDIFEPGAAAVVAIVVGVGAWQLLDRGRILVAGAWLMAMSMLGVMSGLESLDQLYTGASMGMVEEGLGGVGPISEVFLDSETVAPNLTNAVAWFVGFDNTVLAATPATTHILILAEATPPVGSIEVASLESAILWELP